MMIVAEYQFYVFPMQVKGVKGPSSLCIHPPFGIVRGIAVDSLHCVHLGVTKHLLSLWFDRGHKTKDYYIGDKVLL